MSLGLSSVLSSPPQDTLRIGHGILASVAPDDCVHSHSWPAFQHNAALLKKPISSLRLKESDLIAMWTGVNLVTIRKTGVRGGQASGPGGTSMDWKNWSEARECTWPMAMSSDLCNPGGLP